MKRWTSWIVVLEVHLQSHRILWGIMRISRCGDVIKWNQRSQENVVHCAAFEDNEADVVGFFFFREATVSLTMVQVRSSQLLLPLLENLQLYLPSWLIFFAWPNLSLFFKNQWISWGLSGWLINLDPFNLFKALFLAVILKGVESQSVILMNFTCLFCLFHSIMAGINYHCLDF